MTNQVNVFASTLLCEKVLREGDVFSAIRIVDTIFSEIPQDRDPARVLSLFDGALLVFLKSDGPATGKARIIMSSPAGEKMVEYGPFDVDLRGGSSGHCINLQFQMNTVPMPEGLYWFDVYWEDRRLIRAPMQITRREPSTESRTFLGLEGKDRPDSGT